MPLINIPYEYKIVSLNPYSTGLHEKILSLADLVFGKGYLSRETLLSDNVFIQAALVDNGEVAGYSCGMLYDSRSFEKAYDYFKDEIGKKAGLRFPVGITKSLAVRTGFRRRGMGTALFKARNRFFRQKGVRNILMPGWKKPDGEVSIRGIARKNGFRELGLIPDYYYKESLKRGYRCPVCGDPPCRCGAVLFVKSF